MKWITASIAAAVLTTALAAPAFAGHPDRYNNGLSKNDAVKQVMRSFREIDRNRNDVVSRKEVRRQERSHNNHGYRGYERRTRYDSTRYNRKNQLITSQNFRKFDKNHDGKLRRKEVKRTVKRRFDNADRNHDGYLSSREIRRSSWYDFEYGFKNASWSRGYDQRPDRNKSRNRH